jgi:hypothetical protein
MSLPKTFTAGERLFASDLNDNFEYLAGGTPTDGQVLTFNATSGNWEAKDLKMTEKRIEAFTGSGNWTVPAGVTYAIAHMLGGGAGSGSRGTASAGSASSVDFASGLVSSPGGSTTGSGDTGYTYTSEAGAANTGRGAKIVNLNTQTPGNQTDRGGDGNLLVFGAAVTPAATIAVVVGAGGAAGTSGAAGGSGYVYIEYYEEV